MLAACALGWQRISQGLNGKYATWLYIHMYVKLDIVVIETEKSNIFILHYLFQCLQSKVFSAMVKMCLVTEQSKALSCLRCSFLPQYSEFPLEKSFLDACKHWISSWTHTVYMWLVFSLVLNGQFCEHCDTVNFHRYTVCLLCFCHHWYNTWAYTSAQFMEDLTFEVTLLSHFCLSFHIWHSSKHLLGEGMLTSGSLFCDELLWECNICDCASHHMLVPPPLILSSFTVWLYSSLSDSSLSPWPCSSIQENTIARIDCSS